MTVVKDPETGKGAVPIHDKTLMLQGHRICAGRTKEHTCLDRQSAKRDFAEARSAVALGTNSKAGTASVTCVCEFVKQQEKHKNLLSRLSPTVTKPKPDWAAYAPAFH